MLNVLDRDSGTFNPERDRVNVAIRNWAPRFVANGVDVNDLQSIAMQLQSWDGWCAAWCSSGREHAELGLQAETLGNHLSASQHYFQAAMMYHFGKFMFFDHQPEYLAAHQETVRLYNRTLPWFERPGERVAIPYLDGQVLHAILRKPPHVLRPPVVIISPGLESVKEEMHHYGEDFLRRGMAVLAMDGPGQGEGEFDFAMRPDYEVPAGCAIDYLRTRTDLDHNRIGMMGVSVGGYNAMRTGAQDSRISAVIALAIGYGLAEHFDRVPSLTREAFVYKLKARDEEEARVRLREWDLHGVIDDFPRPLLLVMGRQDRLFPAESTEALVRYAGSNAELLMLDDGNHVCNNVPYKYRPYQADWMCVTLLAAPGEGREQSTMHQSKAGEEAPES